MSLNVKLTTLGSDPLTKFLRCTVDDQLEVPAFRFEYAFLLQLREFYGHGGAVHAEIVGELLPVEGDVKGERCLPDGFRGKIRQELLPGRAFADVRDLIIEDQQPVRQHADQISNQLLMMVAGGRAARQKALHIQKEKRTIVLGDSIDVQNRAGRRRIGLPEKVARRALREDISVPPEVLLEDEHGTGQHETHDLRRVARTQDIRAPRTGDRGRLHTVKNRQNLLIAEVCKKRTTP